MKNLLLIAAIASIFALSYADMMSDSLAAHNTERAAYGLSALSWSSSLAHTAQAYAQVMANTGTTAHSKGRVNVGENLAWGSGPSVTTTWLADLWLAERQYFIQGCTFPDCSTTGSWHDVAHYTQLMWQKTTQVGCGLAQASSGMNYYVCHYAPQGNINGEPVYSGSTAGNTQSQAVPATTTPATTNSASTSAPTSTTPTADTSAQSTGSHDQFITDSLDAHNNERNAYGVPPLTWSDSLAQTAQAYAQVQAATGTTAHSKGRVNVGENLAWGSGHGVTTTWLANRWLAEKRYYISGCTFPDCSTTGNWDDVAHYTQMMWDQTTEVGCGLAQASSGMNYYVCHYSPRGNMDGEKVY